MEKIRTVIKPPSALSLNLKEFWQYRELLYFFTWRDIKVKYKQTFLGIIWAVLQPLALMLLFTLVFSKTSIARTDTGMPYELFVLSGLITWTLFHTSVSHAADSMVVNANIIRKIYFPRLIVPVSALAAAFVDFFIAFAVFLVFCVVYGQEISWNAIYYFPLAILICLIAAFGIGSFLGALNVKYRDFRYALPFLLQFLFFATQIIYPASIIGNGNLKYLFALNPVNCVVELFRAGITGVAPDPVILSIGILSAFLFAITGLLYFKKTESNFADII